MQHYHNLNIMTYTHFLQPGISCPGTSVFKTTLLRIIDWNIIFNYRMWYWRTVWHGQRICLPEISIILHNVPGSVELILETVFTITYISGLTDVTTIELKSGTFNEHLPPWFIVGQPSTIHSPHTEYKNCTL